MEKSINVKVFELHDSGVKAGKIAQKLRIKKTVVLDILGEAGKSEGLGDVITKITGVLQELKNLMTCFRIES